MEIKKETVEAKTTTYIRGKVRADLLLENGCFKSLTVNLKQPREDSGYRLWLRDLDAILDLGAIIREIVLDHPDGLEDDSAE